MSEHSKIQAVIFDMDGVLTDSEPLINAAAVAMFKEQGLVVQPDDFLPFVGTGEDRYIGGVAEKYGFSLDLAAAKKRTYEIYLGLVPSRLEAFWFHGRSNDTMVRHLVSLSPGVSDVGLGPVPPQSF